MVLEDRAAFRSDPARLGKLEDLTASPALCLALKKKKKKKKKDDGVEYEEAVRAARRTSLKEMEVSTEYGVKGRQSEDINKWREEVSRLSH